MNSVWNKSRFRREDRGGFYESYFQRALSEILTGREAHGVPVVV